MLDLTVTEAFLFLGMKMETAEREAEAQQQKYWMDFLINIFSQPMQDGESMEYKQERERFIDALRPVAQKEEQRKKYGWNIPQEVFDEAKKNTQPLLMESVEKGE